MKVRLLASLAGCCFAAAPLVAQSLSRTDILALQQQLRDDGCGISHTTRRIDAVTRRALKKCASKYNASSSTPSAVLAAMNIGIGSGSGSSSMGGSLPTPMDVPNKPSTPNPPPSTPVTPGVPMTPTPTAPPDPNAPTTPSTPPKE